SLHDALPISDKSGLRSIAPCGVRTFLPQLAPGAVLHPSKITANLVWYLRNSYTFVSLKLAWGEARRRECIRSDTRPTEQRSPRPISAQPAGRHVFWAEALLLAPHRSTSGYARRSRLASTQNPLPRMYSYFGDTTLEANPNLRVFLLRQPTESAING